MRSDIFDRFASSESTTRFEGPPAIRVLALLLVALQRYVGRRTGSVAISADAAHYQSDLFINIGVGVSIALTSWTGLALIDPLVGMLIAIIVLYSASGIARRSLQILLDHEIPQTDSETIAALARSHTDVCGLHDMKTRFGGSHWRSWRSRWP